MDSAERPANSPTVTNRAISGDTSPQLHTFRHLTAGAAEAWSGSEHAERGQLDSARNRDDLTLVVVATELANTRPR
jgi:hypothetical protein